MSDMFHIWRFMSIAERVVGVDWVGAAGRSRMRIEATSTGARNIDAWIPRARVDLLPELDPRFGGTTR